MNGNRTDVRAIAEGAASLTISEQLKVDENVMVTPHVSINIANIATISVVPIRKPPRIFRLLIILLGLSVGQFLFGFVIDYLISNTAGMPTFSAILNWIAAIAALVFSVWIFWNEWRRREWRLLIGASDGSRNYFTSPDRATLTKVRDVLTDKMNRHDTKATYNINFQTGTIENLNIGKVEQIGAVVAGNGNTVNAATGSGRVGTTETTMTATNSPGAQIGSGHTATGNTYMVDYASVLPEVVRIQQHYDRDPRTQDLARRLAELEFLMRSGTPTQDGKDRLRSIVGDVTSALQAYPAMVQFFQHISRLAGF